MSSISNHANSPLLASAESGASSPSASSQAAGLEVVKALVPAPSGPATTGSRGTRVVAIVPYYFPHYGGGETQLTLLSRALATSGFDVSILTSQPLGAPEHDRSSYARIRRFGAPTELRVVYRSILTHLQGNLRAFDLLYMPLSAGPAYPVTEQLDIIAACIAAHIPVVLRMTSTGRTPELCRMHCRASDLLCQATAIIALNDAIQQELLSAGVAPSAIWRLNNGVDTEHFPGRPTRSLQQRSTFAVIGRFALKKRLCELLEDWVATCAGYSEPALMRVIGSDKDGTEDPLVVRTVQRVATQHPRWVRREPAVPHDQMAAIYAQCDVVVSYSLQEGMSNVLLEAMASGLPVVAPATEANKDLLAHSDNFTFAGGSSGRHALRAALGSCKHWSAIGAANRQRIESGFAATRVYPEYVRRFRHAAGVLSGAQAR